MFWCVFGIQFKIDTYNFTINYLLCSRYSVTIEYVMTVEIIKESRYMCYLNNVINNLYMDTAHVWKLKYQSVKHVKQSLTQSFKIRGKNYTRNQLIKGNNM